eukprot:Blabericola_migrator_1__1485@NODE_1393_length_4632_cov_214_102957_g932_i0_p2_GENE_NODE_1393_length_4632_cov_214_102957_g932_i0NODE_1393_length_4632_cov_214_102957_g932_i0_p2_ORF_typecomplete_len503_score121_30Aha1_N/PF09229_11/3_4e17TPR_16/PF13432_6/1_2TPR_16/PF13432_6/7_5e06TPR_19/PF14559_6/8_6e06TPR_19/PF14559_6/8e03TPR_15/PF13429_6/3_9TPR_15/PF13429_6/6e05TPR_14/PF13428_6/4_4TPR_14/PF13428_6/0_00085TPR_14/PF13428_6/8_2e03TPR_1/PF00515_28/1_8e02TPR_1/PF00515_28/3_1e02TPR_1/PF00515_28/0_00064TP
MALLDTHLDKVGDDLADAIIKDVEDIKSEMSDNMSDLENDGEAESTLLVMATSLKEAGNASMKEGNPREAARHYREGIKKLDRRGNSQEADHIALEIQLNSNLALACMKIEEYFEGTQAATKVLTRDAANVKALLRRGVCHNRLGNFSEAQADLDAVLKIDAKNIDARKELAVLRQKKLESERKQKATFGGFFAKAGDLYSEREAELRGPDKGVTSPPPKKEEAPKTEENRPAPPKAVKTTVEGVDLDEEDLRILEETKKKGYCYFRRELTEEEKVLRESQHVPQKLDASPEHISTGSPQGVSEWNAKGTTYEEKDTTEWCIKMLTPMLNQISWESEACSSNLDDTMKDPSKFLQILESVKSGITGSGSNDSAQRLLEQVNPMKIYVTDKPELKGDAQVMVVRGTKRHYYEYKLDLDWKAELQPILDTQAQRSYEGSLVIDEFSSTVSDDDLLRSVKIVRKVAPSSSPTDMDQQLLDICLSKLKSEVVRQRHEFTKIYQDRQ